MAVIHIQKIAPGPPRHRAVDTPMMLPVPTREAVETISAPKEDMAPMLTGFSLTTRTDSPKSLNCTRPRRMVK